MNGSWQILPASPNLRHAEDAVRSAKNMRFKPRWPSCTASSIYQIGSHLWVWPVVNTSECFSPGTTHRDITQPQKCDYHNGLQLPSAIRGCINWCCISFVSASELHSLAERWCVHGADAGRAQHPVASNQMQLVTFGRQGSGAWCCGFCWFSLLEVVHDLRVLGFPGSWHSFLLYGTCLSKYGAFIL